jgi:hypothetical protein
MARWKPKKLEKYFYVHTNLGRVSYYNWEDDNLDKKHYENGNCFKTEEEAERALKMVKELLLSLHEEVKANGTRKDYIDVLKHYATTGAKGVKTKTLVKVVELMTKDVIEEQSNE